MRGASQQNEHRVTLGAFLDHTLTTTEVIYVRLLHEIIDLRIRQTLEKSFVAQNPPRLILILLHWSQRPALQMQRPNRERNCNALPLEFVPHARANGVIDLIDSGMVAHVELDLVDHSEIGKVDQKNFYLWFG